MQIDIKKDIEEEYKDELYKGFSTKEMIAIVTAFGTAALVIFFLWYFVGLALEICVFISIPFAMPSIACGFYKIQGLSLWMYIKEMYHMHRTRCLTYDAGEMPKRGERK